MFHKHYFEGVMKINNRTIEHYLNPSNRGLNHKFKSISTEYLKSIGESKIFVHDFQKIVNRFKNEAHFTNKIKRKLKLSGYENIFFKTD